MIYGIGTDIVRIARIESALERHGERFARRILGAEELEKYRHRSAQVAVRGVRFVATRFAAKEAFSKAIGLGMRMPMTWRTLQILNAPSGKPIAIASGALKNYMDLHDLSAQISITDETEYAVAFVLVEQIK